MLIALSEQADLKQRRLHTASQMTEVASQFAVFVIPEQVDLKQRLLPRHSIAGFT